MMALEIRGVGLKYAENGLVFFHENRKAYDGPWN